MIYPSFTHLHKRSTKILRVHYGLEGMKYIIQIYEGEVNGNNSQLMVTKMVTKSGDYLIICLNLR